MRKISPYNLTCLLVGIVLLIWSCKKLDLTIPAPLPEDPFAAQNWLLEPILTIPT